MPDAPTPSRDRPRRAPAHWERLAAAWHPWLEPDVLARLLRWAVAIVAVGSAVGFVVAALDGTRHAVDAAIIDGVVSAQRDGVVTVLDAAGRLAGFTTVLVLGALVAVTGRLRSGHWRLGQLLVVSVCGALAVIGTVKLVVPRDRPEVALFDAFSSAYPSGHAARAVVVLGLTAWLLTRGRSGGARLAGWIAAGAGTAVVAGSRVYLGMHWPTDVVVGALIGAAWLGVVLTIAGERRIVPPPGGGAGAC